MTTVVLFLLAAGAGAALRHFVRSAQLRRPGRYPWATVSVNWTGSFLLGLITAWDGPGATVVGVGLLGALTTFSTFAAEVVVLAESGDRHARRLLVGYVVASLGGGIALARLGLALG